MIAWKFALHHVDPASTVPFTSAGSAKYPKGTTVTLPRIVGHRDVQSTDCPGGNLYARLGWIRHRVAQLVPSYQAGLAPVMLDADVTGDGLVDPIQYRPGPGGDAQWRATPTGTLTRQTISTSGTFRPVVGDFDGNGFSDVMWHATGSARDYVWWSGPTGITSQSLQVNGSFVPIAGDFDGNGVDDIFWYATGLAQDSVWYFRTDRSHVDASRDAGPDHGRAARRGLRRRRDRRHLLLRAGHGGRRLWSGTSSRTFVVTPLAVNGWYEPVALDATGDGAERHPLVHAWGDHLVPVGVQPDGSSPRARSPPPRCGGQPTVGDFDGDGLDDVLIIAAGTASDAVWYSTPTGDRSTRA